MGDSPAGTASPFLTPLPRLGTAAAMGPSRLQSPPLRTHGRCGDKHLVYFRIADIASPNERVIEGGKGGGGGTRCIHGGRVRGGKNKREIRWLARRQRSLSLSFSFSFYLFSSLLLKHIEGGEKGNIKINCEPCRRFNDFK